MSERPAGTDAQRDSDNRENTPDRAGGRGAASEGPTTADETGSQDSAVGGDVQDDSVGTPASSDPEQMTDVSPDELGGMGGAGSGGAG